MRCEIISCIDCIQWHSKSEHILSSRNSQASSEIYDKEFKTVKKNHIKEQSQRIIQPYFKIYWSAMIINNYNNSIK